MKQRNRRKALRRLWGVMLTLTFVFGLVIGTDVDIIQSTEVYAGEELIVDVQIADELYEQAKTSGEAVNLTRSNLSGLDMFTYEIAEGEFPLFYSKDEENPKNSYFLIGMYSLITEEDFENHFASIDGVTLMGTKLPVIELEAGNYKDSEGNVTGSYNSKSFYDSEDPEEMHVQFTIFSNIYPDSSEYGISFQIMLSEQESESAEDAFEDVLTDGKLVVKSVPPTKLEDAYVIFEYLYEYGYSMNWDSLNSTFTKGILTRDEGGVIVASKEVEIVYDYDEDVKKSIDSIAAALPRPEGDEMNKFYPLSDMEFINFIISGANEYNMADFSGELKSIINNKNFHIDVRMGDSHPFYTAMGGIAEFTYDDTLYYVGDFSLGVYAEHVIYVDDNTTDIVAAVKERVKTVFGETAFSDVNVEFADTGKTMEDFLDEEREEYKSSYTEMKEQYDQYGWNAETVGAYASADEYAEAIIKELYYDDEAYYHFLMEAEDGWYQITDGDYGINFAVIKDSSKVNNTISFLTSDVKTDIAISTMANSSIPLDTMIHVDQLTSGEEYDKITNALASKKVTASETYDLSLHSDSLKQNITKVSNGEFTVSIPISDALKGKALIVYYVDDSGNVTEHEVAISDGDAVFNTNHFSIYTLAAVEETTTTVTDDKSAISPKTGDRTRMGVYIALMLVIGMVLLVRGSKRIRRS